MLTSFIPHRKRRFAPLALAGLLIGSAGCASSTPPPASPGPYAPGQWAPPPAAAPTAPPATPPLGSGLLDVLAAAQKALPCPLPGLPPELTRLIDCSALRTATNAVAYVPRALTGALPPAVDHRANGLTGPVKDQNPVGACSGFAISSVMDNALRRRGRTDVVSPLHVFATYTRENDLGALRGKAMTSEPVWPFDKVRACRIANPEHGGYCQSEAGVVPGSGQNDPVLLGERSRADAMGMFRIDALELMKPADVDQIALLLAEGEAVWAAIAFDESSWKHSNVKSGYLPYYPPVDGLGHAVVLQGYRLGPTGREFLFQNSWGADWGLGGYLWIPESMLRTHLLHAYRVRISDGGGAPGVPPSIPGLPSIPGFPQVSPTPAAGCPSGQTAVFGVCLPIPTPGTLPAPGPLPMPSGGGTLPSIGGCPSGSVPNPLSPGQCVAVPSFPTTP